jgi:hypothetical protein
MPIFAVAFAALVFGGCGLVIGGGIGAMAGWLLHLRGIRVREIQGAEGQPAEESFSSGCGVLLASSLFGGVLGCVGVLSLGYLVAVRLAG